MINLFSTICRIFLESSKLKMVHGELYLFTFIFFLSIYHSLFTINPSLVKDQDIMPCALHLQQPWLVHHPGKQPFENHRHDFFMKISDLFRLCFYLIIFGTFFSLLRKGRRRAYR